MTEDEKNHEKLATMNQLSKANDTLECLKCRMERWSAMMQQVVGVIAKGVSDKPFTSLAVDMPDLEEWPSGEDIERTIREFEETNRRISELRERMRKWGAV